MATLVLIIGVVVFGIGISGQIGLWRRVARKSSAGDRRGARIVITLAAIIIGAWLVIASTAHLLHSHSQSQHRGGVTETQQTP